MSTSKRDTLQRVSGASARWIVVGLCALALGACSGIESAGGTSSASTPSPAQPTASAAWVTFTSDRYAYSIEHPADWRVVEQAGSAFLEGMKIGSPGTDTIGSPDSFRYNSDDGVLVISAHELEAAESLPDFTIRVSNAAACGGSGLGLDNTTLDAVPAEYRHFECGNFDWIQITAIHGGRGYVVWAVATEAPQARERPINDQFLATFQFTD